jgi:hypothetical protein
VRRWAVATVVFATAACSYHNVIYNARQLFFEGEVARRAGKDSVSMSRYVDVVRKTGEALRDRPDGEWADQALVLHGRARFRLGELREARAALNDAIRTSPAVAGEARVYLAAIHAELGDDESAMTALNRALAGSLDEESRSEAHLLRGRLLLERGLFDLGGWDLDRASEAGFGHRVEAGVERLRWLVIHEEEARARSAFGRLLRDPRAGVRSDTIVGLADAATLVWGPAMVATMLDEVANSPWDRVARGQVALTRAGLLDEAGDTVAARAQLMDVAAGLGSAAADARLTLAQWQLQRARDLDAVYSVRTLLLPAGRDARATSQVEVIETLESLTGMGYAQPLAFFAAAEVARDELGAQYVARGLFLAYAAAAPADPWAPKALLAALDISPDEGDRAWLRGRLEADPDSPYVLAASGGSSAGYQELEEELDVRLRELTRR